MKLRFYLILGSFFLFAGTLLGSQYFSAYFTKTNAVPAVPPVTSSSVMSAGTVMSGIPARISIPSVHISVDIDQGHYISGTKGWTLGETHPSWAVNTAPANTQGGNTYIYGHNRKGIFATLPDTKIGAKATVATTNGHRFTYELVSVRDTVPTDTSLFSYQGPPIMTVQTCTGLFYQHRHLMTFKLVGAA